MNFGVASAPDPHHLTYAHLYGIGYQNVSDRTLVYPVLGPGERTAIIVTIGQSNSGNWVGGGTLYTPTNAKAENFNFFNGGLYRAKDPLLGCDGTTGNYATRLADKLITAGNYDRVIVAPIALGGSMASVWLGDADERIRVLASRLASVGYTPTHILWHQGEKDAEIATSQAAYTATIRSIVARFRGLGIAAPFYVSKASWSTQLIAGSAAVRAAQAAVVDNVGIFAGPDTDTLNNTFRDGSQVHFNAAGAQAVADLWYAAIT